MKLPCGLFDAMPRQQNQYNCLPVTCSMYNKREHIAKLTLSFSKIDDSMLSIDIYKALYFKGLQQKRCEYPLKITQMKPIHNTETMIAGRLLENIRNRNIPHEKNRVANCVTISIGAATGTVKYAQSAADFIKRADEMLYKSKQSGRDRYSFESV